MEEVNKYRLLFTCGVGLVIVDALLIAYTEIKSSTGMIGFFLIGFSIRRLIE